MSIYSNRITDAVLDIPDFLRDNLSFPTQAHYFTTGLTWACWSATWLPVREALKIQEKEKNNG